MIISYGLFDRSYAVPLGDLPVLEVFRQFSGRHLYCWLSDFYMLGLRINETIAEMAKLTDKDVSFIHSYPTISQY